MRHAQGIGWRRMRLGTSEGRPETQLSRVSWSSGQRCTALARDAATGVSHRPSVR
jgi:hypothetical protein